jgi:5-methyltetrahydrofolate--homocysteine methyltransferase
LGHGRIDRRRLLGTRVLDDFPLADLVDYIDWSPFFMAWELKGKYPRDLRRPDVGAGARELFDDAQRCWTRSSPRSC